MDKNTEIFQFDNAGWPENGEKLPDVFVKFSFRFDFTERDLNRLRSDHAHTSFGFKWLYVSDDKIFIHRGLRCVYQLRLDPAKTIHTAIYYFYQDVDKLMSEHALKPMETLLMILSKWSDHSSEALRSVRSVAYGHAIADALGVPAEFMSRDELKEKPVKDMMGFGSHYVPAGTWSDDTSMALATMDSLASGINYEDIMSKFCDWKVKAAYTATDEVFDMGVSTNTAISRFQKGSPALKCGCTDENDNGNGSLMRIYPAVLRWYYTHNQKFSTNGLDELVFDISALTHAHLRSCLACGIYARVLLHLLSKRTKKSIMDGLCDAQMHYSKGEAFQNELTHFSRLFDPNFELTPEDQIKSSGYVVASLEAAIWCVLRTDSYEACVLKAVNLGSDTDTVAAIAGSLAGCLYGLEGIPARWIDGLLRRDMLDDICKRFTEGLYNTSGSPRHKAVDIHAHVLYDIDDGAVNMDMSISMLRQLSAQGITDVFCASHSWGDMACYWENFKLLRHKVKELGLSINVHSGCEILADDSAWEKLSHHKLPTMAMSDFVMLEFEMFTSAKDLVAFAREVIELTPYTPIIAHAERYDCLKYDQAAYNEIKHRKIPLQINAYSLAEEKNVARRDFARQLLKDKMVMFIGSDAHRTSHRPPNVKSGIDYIYENCDKEYADDICFRNAERLLIKHQ